MCIIGNVCLAHLDHLLVNFSFVSQKCSNNILKTFVEIVFKILHWFFLWSRFHEKGYNGGGVVLIGSSGG